MSNTTEKRFNYADRNGIRPISEAELEKILARLGQDYTLDFVVRDLDAGIPYVGADFRVTNPVAMEEKR
ncbi:hypothetical protein D3C87_2125840 [compost metagenome]